MGDQETPDPLDFVKSPDERGETAKKNPELTRRVKQRLREEQRGPRIGKTSNGKTIIALQEEGYYLDVRLTPKEWKLKIKDFRTPPGNLTTFEIPLDKVTKILTSSLAKPIRDTYKKIFYEKGKPYLNKTIQLIQENASRFEELEEEETYEPKAQSKADRLVQLALQQDIKLFRDQFGFQYAQIPITLDENLEETEKQEASEASEANSLLIPPHPETYNDIYDYPRGFLYKNSSTSSTAPLTKQTWPLSSEFFKTWLSGLMYKTDRESAKPEHLKTAVIVLDSMANEKPIINLWNRVAPDGEGGIYLDMTNERWEVIHITKKGWRVEPAPLIFRRYPHQKSLCYPVRNGDISKIFKYLNIGCRTDTERHVNEQLLYLVTLITAYIPDIPHAGTILYGGAGHVKTMTQILSRELIDPSSVEYNSLPGKLVSLIQILDQHYYPVFDNLGDLNNEVSDIFCRAITGAAFQVRKLFTDDEAFLRAFKRVVNMNGINIPGTNPDLLDRVLVFEAPYISMSNRKPETEIKEEFEQDAPEILGAILDILVEALNIYPTIELDRLPRMADFALWGCAVTEALGIPHKKFINAYYRNILNVKGDVIKSRVTGQVLIELLERMISDKNPSRSWLMKNLHRTLMTEAKQDNINLNVLPPDPTRLGRELNIIEGNLPSLGYTMRKKDTNRGVKVIFSKLKNTTLDSQLEEKPESYSNVWKVSDLRDLLKPSVDEGGQDSPDPVKSSEQVNEKLTELKHSLRELGKPVSAQEVYEAYKDILELDSENEVEKMLEHLRSSDEVALVGLNRYKYLEEKIPGRLNDDIKKLLAYLEARKEEALTIEDIAKNLNWSLERTRKILAVTDRDGATYQPRPGYWRLD